MTGRTANAGRRAVAARSTQAGSRALARWGASTCDESSTCSGQTCDGSSTCSGDTCSGDTCDGSDTCDGDSGCDGGGDGGGDGGTLKGYVTDSYTTDPITWATVSAGTKSDGTDAYGYYEITGLSTGNYSVTASATGYVNKTYPSVRVSSGMTTWAYFALSKISLSASKSTIMTGGVENDVHQCTITATVSEYTGSVDFEIVGLTGYNIPASLSESSVNVDENGHASTTLTSSDLVETITVKATFEGYEDTITVEQDTSDMAFTFDPEEIVTDGESTMDIYLEVLQHSTGIPVPGHYIGFAIVEVWDEDDNLVYESEWADYGTLLSSEDTTDSNGIAATVLQAGTKGGTITIEATDYNDWIPQP